MRPVTGNNNTSTDVNKVSVRIDSGGHSFSVDTLPAKALEDGVTVEFAVITHKSVLVPSECLDAGDAANWLSVSGLACNSDEQPLCVVSGRHTVVAAVAKTAVEDIAAKIGERAEFTSPLLSHYDSDGKKLHICTFGNVSYFKLYEDNRLRFAEAFKTAGEDDILYYAQGLNAHFGLSGYLIYIYGDRSAETAKLLKRYFKGVRCE